MTGTPDQLREAYSRAAEHDSPLRWHRFPARWPRNRYEAAAALCVGGGSLLELGFGDGLLLYNLADRYDRLVGVDFVQQRVRAARSELERRGLADRVELVAHAVDDGLPERLEGERFDCIVWADVIEHVVDVVAVFRDIARLAKPGGHLVTVTPNVASLKRRLALVRGRFPFTSGSDEGFEVAEGEMFDGGHVHYFTFRAVERLHREHGFDADVARFGFGRFGRLHSVWPTLMSGGVAVRSRRE